METLLQARHQDQSRSMRQIWLEGRGSLQGKSPIRNLKAKLRLFELFHVLCQRDFDLLALSNLGKNIIFIIIIVVVVPLFIPDQLLALSLGEL